MAQSMDIARMIASIVHDLNPNNYDDVLRKAIMLPVTTRTHLGDIAGEIHGRALARPANLKLYAALCADIITGGFDGARPGSGPAFRRALLPRCYDVLKQSCRATATTRFKQSRVSDRQADYFVTNCVFIGELYRLGVYPDYIVWSFVNDLIRRHTCAVQARCLGTLLALVAPKLSETYPMTREMSLKMKRSIDEIRQKYSANRIRKQADTPAEQSLLLTNMECPIKPPHDHLKAVELQHIETLEMLKKMTNPVYQEQSDDIEKILTPFLISCLGRDQVNLVISLNRSAIIYGNDKMSTVVGSLLADLVNKGRLKKYNVVKGFHVMLKDSNERYPGLPEFLAQVRNTFEDRLSVNPVNETVFGANRTSRWFECNLIKQMINEEFVELMIKFGGIHCKERQDVVRLVKPVLHAILKNGQLNTVESIIYTAINCNDETVQIKAGQILAKLVIKDRLIKMSVLKGFIKILADLGSSDYFTNIPEVLSIIRTSFEAYWNS